MSGCQKLTGSRLPFRFYSLLLSCLLLVAASCQTHISSLSETLVGRTAETLRNASPQRDGIGSTENIMLLGHSTAVYTVILAKGITDSTGSQLTTFVDQKVSEMPFFTTVRTAAELAPKLSKNRLLEDRRQLYFESLTRVSVSNKDISNQIARAFDLRNLIIFQVDKWPCSECTPPLRIRIKLRAIDLPTGLIIWTGIDELEVKTAEDATQKQLIELSDELLTQFQNRFERKWHRKRFQNLSKLARK